MSVVGTLLLMYVVALTAAPAQEPGKTGSPPGLVWCGLDYSRVKMIGTQDFRDPNGIFPSKPEAWNTLFIKEMVPKLEAMAPGVRSDLGAVAALNAKLTASCIVRQDGTAAEMVTPSHLTPDDIAAAVKGYELESKQGLGLVFIIDRLVKAQQTGCLYVVFFDLATRKVIQADRLCEDAGGAGFRNYWFGPVKRAVKKLPPLYQKARAVH